MHLEKEVDDKKSEKYCSNIISNCLCTSLPISRGEFVQEADERAESPA
jgi:hypothetical protein